MEVSPGYPLGQLARALQTDENKARSWRAVVEGMLSGALRIGSRTPVAEAPVWATLEVLQGGFASGRLLAGGELQPHELELAERLGLNPDRRALNGYFVSEAGFQELGRWLESGCYRVQLPEEGALLTVAWLSRQGPRGAARALLDQLLPHFSRLRFYPIPADQPGPSGEQVSRIGVGELCRRLQGLRQAQSYLRMRIAVQVSLPFLDRVVELLQETVEEGWPCQKYPEAWAARATTLLQKIPPGRPSQRRLAAYLQRCLEDPQSLSGLDLSRIRCMLRGIEAKRGLPGSVRLETLRQQQRDQVSRPTRREQAQELLPRLQALDSESGLEDPALIQAPPALEGLVQQARMGTLGQLWEWGLLPSAEVLATLLPKLSGRLRGADFPPPLDRLYRAVYQAIRRRRSLLLLNLEHQVKLNELPWVQAVEPFGRGGVGGGPRACLEEVVSLTVRAWPHQILPNRLLRELGALATQAGLDLPLVEELAADIFQNQFSPKFLRAAQEAARLLRGSLYQRYYSIDPDQVLGLGPGDLVTLCRFRAGLPEKPTRGWGTVSEHGRVIEQQQILTTHNLATLVPLLGPLPWDEFARRCLHFVLEHELLDRRKLAHSWRQMVFFASMLEESEQAGFLEWAGPLSPMVEGLVNPEGAPFLGWVGTSSLV